MTTKLEDKLDKERREAFKRHKKAVGTYKEGIEVAKDMPVELANLDWWEFIKVEEGKWYLETHCMGEEPADELIKSLKIMGIYGIISRWKHGGGWEYTGSIMAGETEIVIKVDGGSMPPNCRIEETKEWKEVTTYKAICEETGETL